MDLLEPTNYVADEGSEEIILADAWTEVGYAGDGGISGWFEYGFHKNGKRQKQQTMSHLPRVMILHQPHL
jgi:hypothetical protein